MITTKWDQNDPVSLSVGWSIRIVLRFGFTAQWVSAALPQEDQTWTCTWRTWPNFFWFCRFSATFEGQVSFAGHRSQITLKSKSIQLYWRCTVRITRDSREVYWYFHATIVWLCNFNEKFLGVVSVLNGLKYSFHTCSVKYILSS